MAQTYRAAFALSRSSGVHSSESSHFPTSRLFIPNPKTRRKVLQQQIRRAWRQLNRLHSGGFQDLQEFSGEQRIPVVDQVSLPGQKAFRSVTEVASDLPYPNAIGLPGHSGDLDPPTRQVDSKEHEESRPTLARPGREGEEIRRHNPLPMPGEKLPPVVFRS